MGSEDRPVRAERVFKTDWFAKVARKGRISDSELCAAIQQVMLGQADDLGGGVFKKRLGRNLYRSILLTRSGQFWVYEYLFAKKDQANISEGQLMQYRRLAKLYAEITEGELETLLEKGKWEEICR
ncbi:MAG: type II toxin-antitoxin system RelE/ParE family toxin [Acidobacteriota bacterium]